MQLKIDLLYVTLSVPLQSINKIRDTVSALIVREHSFCSWLTLLVDAYVRKGFRKGSATWVDRIVLVDYYCGAAQTKDRNNPAV